MPTVRIEYDTYPNKPTSHLRQLVKNDLKRTAEKAGASSSRHSLRPYGVTLEINFPTESEAEDYSWAIKDRYGPLVGVKREET